MKALDYALVSPIKNEGRFIGRTIEAVMAQTIIPAKWVIVSDGSTDDSDRIVQQYSRRCSFIELIQTENRQRNFGAKVAAFNVGVRHLSLDRVAFLGNLDGDVTFGPTFFERLLSKFLKDASLGVAGGFVLEREGDHFRSRYGNVSDSVPGAALLFRMDCYKQIGGYSDMKWGGEDVLVQLMARQLGWGVQAFRDLKVFHYKKTDSGGMRSIRLRFIEGRRSWGLGYLPLYIAGKAAKRVLRRPVLLGSLAMILGYIVAGLVRDVRAPRSSVRYLHREQRTTMGRLFALSRPHAHFDRTEAR